MNVDRVSTRLGKRSQHQVDPENLEINATTRADKLYSRLGAAGIDKKFLCDFVLPNWWQDEVVATKAGFLELATRLSRRLGIDLETLLDENASLDFAVPATAKFKGEMRVNCPEKIVAICKQAAELAVYAMKHETLSLPDKGPKEIRNDILASGERWVGLRSLVHYCWKTGVPVLHVTNFPKGVKKPDGMLIVFDGRPAIVLCKNQRQPAWLLFILAHEIGHLVSGHGEDNGVIVDLKIDDDPESMQDEEERVADDCAIELLTGEKSRVYNSSTVLNATQLADAATRKGEQDHVYPGHVVLNYTHGLGDSFHSLGNAALKKLDPKPDAPRVLRECLASHLDWSQLPEENAEYLMRITGTDATALR